ncbi:MAG: pyruvate kinase [Eubacterium sp.]|jgi:pyruvate kinase|nr:pyruvate kinase [Eubacterium sp.]
MRKTKIICTLGPATDREGVLEKLIITGMNVARLNFSHGSYEEHSRRIETVKALREKHHMPTAIMLDTKGPEIRLGLFKDKEVILEEGQKFVLYATEREGDKDGISISYPDLYQDVSVGSTILIDDGLVEMEVIELNDTEIVCQVKNGGKVSDRKGVNVPNVKLSMPFLSEKDKEDILFGIKNDVDFVAASFVRRADDINKMRKFLNDHGGYDVHIISKIENNEGVENIEEILEASEGVMIARGDMGVEIPYEEVPVIQKMIIKKGMEAGKQIITATQMLDSMMKNPRPTRAETTDVANAIYDGTGAIMLSGETAAGAYPVESLETMVRIADRTEQDIDYRKRFFARDRKANPDITDAICHATCTSALDLNAKAIVTVTKSGYSARNISKYCPACNVVCGTTDEKVARQLSMVWGAIPVILENKKDVFELFDHALEAAEEKGYLSKGDITVITSGVPIGVSGTTNMIKIQMV